jgi:hypothetical protein
MNTSERKNRSAAVTGVGSQPNLEIRWAIREHFLAAVNLAGLLAGTFLQQSPPSKETVFFNLGLTYRF